MLKYILIGIVVVFLGIFLFFTVIGHFSVGMIPTVINDYQQGYRPFKITGHAMEPSFKDGQYWLGTPYSSTIQSQRGDVVILQSPQDKNLKIERIIGIPGDKIKIQGGKVYLNGQILQEPYVASNINTDTSTYPSEGQELIIPANDYYVLGDNRPSSLDSRQFGFVPLQNILFKLTICYKNCP